MSELPSSQQLRASAVMDSSGAVTLPEPNQFEFTKEATFIVKISDIVGALDFDLALQSSTDGTNFETIEDIGSYTAEGTSRTTVKSQSKFGKYQRLYITKNGAGTCTLEIRCDMIEVW